METDTIRLIQRILDGEGEEEAFAELVRKYQKRVHAHAWQMIGDYHIAEEITQDAFIQVYKKLSTLRNIKLFDGWLYVIVYRLCLNWIEREKPVEESIENIPDLEIEEHCYLHYEMEQRDMETIEHQREMVKRILNKLPESERKVLTFYYLGEMTAKEIANYMGVSVNTIKSKLRRARNRLQLKDELLIDETLGGLQLSTDLTDSIMRVVKDIKPEPAVVKPSMPWAVIGTSVALIILFLGGMNQYIAHYQRAYNFEALSEPTIEIVESPINIDIVSKPALRKQVGRDVIDSKNKGAGKQVSETVLAADAPDSVPKFSTSTWIQTNRPFGDPVYNIFGTSENNLYAMSSTGVYGLTKDATSWTRISASVPIMTFQSPITEYQGILYTVGSDKIIASTDNGETWEEFCARPKGQTIGLIITDKTQEHQTETSFVMFFALRDKGVFRSDDAGTHWIPINNGMKDERITAVAAIADTVFVGTHQGLYCLRGRMWERLAVDKVNVVQSLAVSENNLYVAAGQEFQSNESLELKNTGSRKLYLSTDLGTTWTDITPKNRSFMRGASSGMSTGIWANGKTLLVSGRPTFRSKDGGQTWTDIGIDPNSLPLSHASVLAINENTFYRVDQFGIYRTTDSGSSWHPFMDGILGAKSKDLIVFDSRIYTYTDSRIYELTDIGRGWKSVNFDYPKLMSKQAEKAHKGLPFIVESKPVIIDDSFYAVRIQNEELHIFRLGQGEVVFSTVQRIPIHGLRTKVKTAKIAPNLDVYENNRDLKVNNQALYIEYKNRLFKWKIDSSELTDTGLVDTGRRPDSGFKAGFKVAASAENVYVGMRDGKLFRSLDGGDNWTDVTLSLPVNFTFINDMAIAGSKVYVATDKGVLSSRTGEHWRMLTDDSGKQIIIDKLTMNGLDLYGAGEIGVHYLESHSYWKQISPSNPDKVVSIAVSGDKLYIATDQQEIFYILIKKELPSILTQGK